MPSLLKPEGSVTVATMLPFAVSTASDGPVPLDAFHSRPAGPMARFQGTLS